MTIRWISYTQLHMPGNTSFQLGFHSSLSEAKLEFASFCRGVGTDDCSMNLYGVPDSPGLRDDMIAQAKDFVDVGCPFDYPNRQVTMGPKGGVRVEKC